MPQYPGGGVNIHKPCPHCGATMDWIYFKGRQVHVVSCRKCHCRWDVHGSQIKWGKGCPVYVRA